MSGEILGLECDYVISPDSIRTRSDLSNASRAPTGGSTQTHRPD
jgi:hypothetical protein